MNNTALFFICYLLPMIFTYPLRWAIFFWLIAVTLEDILALFIAGYSGILSGFLLMQPPTIIIIILALLTCHLIMILVTWRRGIHNGKTYLAAFPIVGAIFDLLLIFIPFVSTVMNIVVLILGLPSKEQTKRKAESK